MNILVTGSNGQLGTSLKTIEDTNENNHYFFTDFEELDITNEEAVEAYITNNDINVIVNCAAYTAVDKAEEDRDNAYLVNNKGVEILSRCIKNANGYIIHISTDYVYNNRVNVPHKERDFESPKNIYAKSKYAGEIVVFRMSNRNIIIRTSWLYSEYGNNFVDTMQHAAKDNTELNVVYDQVGTPTYAHDLAECIIKIINTENFQGGIYNYSNEGVCSWYDFAKEIIKMSKIKCKINPITTDKYPTKAKRPTYSVLAKEKIKEALNIEIPYWKDSLKTCINNIKENNKEAE